MIDGNELAELLGEADISIPMFASAHADVHPQTVYNAIKGGPLKPRSFRQISKARDELRRKSKVAG